MKGKTVCRMHGGKTPTGFASPNLKTGKHSKYLRLKGISDDIERHRTAEDILTQNEEIAHTRVLLEKTLYRLLSGSDIPSYKELGRIVVKMKLHARNGNQAQFTTAFGELSTMVELGAGIQSDMIEYLNLSDHLRKQIESQRKQAIENKEMVKITQTQKLLEIFITTATESLRTHLESSLFHEWSWNPKRKTGKREYLSYGYSPNLMRLSRYR